MYLKTPTHSLQARLHKNTPAKPVQDVLLPLQHKSQLIF